MTKPASQLLGEYDSAGNALYETIYQDEQSVAVRKPAASVFTLQPPASPARSQMYC